MNSRKKEIEKKMLVKKTINSMNKQIEKLEQQKQIYINAGKEAKQKGLQSQYELALSGLKMTIQQQKKVCEMKLNFEITSQMKDMTLMTSEFLKGMGSLSKDMMKLTKEKDFLKVEKQFNEAMENVETQASMIDAFMEDSNSTFASQNTMGDSENMELEALMENNAADEESDSIVDIDKELEELKRKMKN